MSDKRLEEMAAILFPAVDRLIVTEPDNVRAAGIDRLLDLAAGIVSNDRVVAVHLVSEALRVAKDITPPNGIICVTGSLHLLGEVKTAMKLS
jgi:dihydrofolate synthase/folylpolyglutamate synthase